jgi:hypothetical protein
MSEKASSMPIEEDILISTHDATRHEAIKSFLARALGDPGKILDNLEV